MKFCEKYKEIVFLRKIQKSAAESAAEKHQKGQQLYMLLLYMPRDANAADLMRLRHFKIAFRLLRKYYYVIYYVIALICHDIWLIFTDICYDIMSM